jgi:hypothetical protein
MTSSTLLGIGALIALVAFVAFAFRQGMQVPRSGRDPSDHVSPP